MARDDAELVSRWAMALVGLTLVAVGLAWVRAPHALSSEVPPPPRFPIAPPAWTGAASPLVTPAPESRGGCLYLFRLPALEALSDKGMMDHVGFHNGSPLELWRDGAPLAVHKRGDECDDGSTHTPAGMAVRTSTDVSASRWELRWSTAAPDRSQKDGAVQQVWYVFPGMMLELRTLGRWDDAWGPPVVHLAAVAAGSDTPATLGWGGGRADIAGANGPVQADLLGDPTGQAVWVKVPIGGPALAIHDLAIGNGETATVLLGTLARATGAESASTLPFLNLPHATRTGTPQRSPARLGPADDACRRLVPRPDLAPISDLRLFETYNLVSASPVVVFEDDAPLTPHDRGTGCTGAFAHAPNALAVRPARDPMMHKYTVSFDPAPEVAVTVRGGTKTTLWWGLPGTTLSLAWAQPLVERPHEVVVDLLVTGGARPATLRLGATERPIAAGSGPQQVVLSGVTSGPWTLELEAPADGPVVLVRSVTERAAPPVK